MAVARLVAIAGPDKGCVFDIPLRGGGIGREAGNVVQLSDLAVSRSHSQLMLRDGAMVLVDAGGRNRTVVNGQAMATRGMHVLESGDEITVGETTLLYQPLETGEGDGPSAPGSTAVRVTMEIGSREVLGVRGRDIPGSEGSRARRHLSALARLGDTLRVVENRERLGTIACEQAMAALAGQRAHLLLEDAFGRLNPSAVVVSRNGPERGPERGPDRGIEGRIPALPRDIADKVARQGKALAVDTEDGPCVAAPIYGAHDERAADAEKPIGLMCVERPVGAGFDDIDLTAMVSLAHLTSAALANISARAQLSHDNQVLSQQLGGRTFVGESAPARTLRAFVSKVAPSDATVLLTGESGSGKEMVARAVHRASRRARAPFVAVNCAALTESLIESELFGHEKGAFTGAAERKQGRFELADRGTLFLDEVGELPLSCQTKFLRVLEEQVFERVGGGRSIAVDVRVVAATNRNLLAMAQRGLFREDLYYRLSVIHTVVPPLRQRKDDIPLLAGHFLENLRHQVPRRITGFSPRAMRTLEAHEWPGNVRELRNAIEYAIVLGASDKIEVADLPPHLSGADPAAARTQPITGVPPEPGGTLAAASTQPLTMGPDGPLVAEFPGSGVRMPTAPFASAPGYPPGQAGHHHQGVAPGGRTRIAPTPPAGTPVAVIAPQPLRELEKQGIIAALRATGGNKAQAAQLLEIDRSTLYKKIKDYGIK